MKIKKIENENVNKYQRRIRNIAVKCQLENGQIKRHYHKGNPEDTDRFIENLEGKIVEILILN